MPKWLDVQRQDRTGRVPREGQVSRASHRQSHPFPPPFHRPLSSPGARVRISVLSGEAAAAPPAPAARARSREPVPASSARRSRPAEQADGKSPFLPHINKVGTGRTALGAEREGRGVGSLLHGPLPAQPRLLPRELPPPAGAGRAAGRRMGLGARSGQGTGPPVANRLSGAVGAARAGCRQGASGAQFLPGSLGPAARPPPERLGSSRPRVHSHGRTLSHTGTPPLVHRVTHTLRVAHALPLLDRAVSRTRSVPHAHLFPRTLALSHGHCILRGKHGSSRPFAASLSWDTRRAPLTFPFSHPGCHTSTHTHSDPHTRSHKRRVSHAGTRAAPPPQRAPAPHAHRLAGTRRLRLPHSRTSRRPRLLSEHVTTRTRPPPHPRTHTRGPSRSRPLGAVPAPRPGGRVCALAGNPRTFPAASLAALRRHRRASCAAPVRNSLCLFPPDGRAGGGRKGQQVPHRAARGSAPRRAPRPGPRGAAAQPPPAAGHPQTGEPPSLLSRLRCHTLHARPPSSVPG